MPPVIEALGLGLLATRPEGPLSMLSWARFFGGRGASVLGASFLRKKGELQFWGVLHARCADWFAIYPLRDNSGPNFDPALPCKLAHEKERVGP